MSFNHIDVHISFFILAFRKLCGRLFKSSNLQSIIFDFVAFAGLLVDNMQFDAVIFEFSI